MNEKYPNVTDDDIHGWAEEIRAHGREALVRLDDENDVA